MEAFKELEKRVVHGYMSEGKYPKYVSPWLGSKTFEVGSKVVTYACPIDLKVAIERFRDFAVRLGRITAVVLIQRRWKKYKERNTRYYSPGRLYMLMSLRAKKNWQKLVNRCSIMSTEPLFVFRMLYSQLEARRLKATPARMGQE